MPTEPVVSRSTPVLACVVTGSYAPKATVDVDDTIHFAVTDAVMLRPTPGELAANNGLAARAKDPAAIADKI
jgi:hypothetical protein